MENTRRNELVAKARNGDRKALEELLDESYADIYFYALQLTKYHDLAQDISQDSCEEICKTIRNIREITGFVNWCRKIVYHRYLKWLEANKKTLPKEDEDGELIAQPEPDEIPVPLPQEVVENKELRMILLNMLDQLPQTQSAALMLQVYDNMSIQEIAEALNMKENTVKTALRRGKLAMKKRVEEYEKENGIRLHCVGIVPLLLYLYGLQRAQSDVAAAAVKAEAMSALAPSIAAFGTAGATGAAATAGGSLLSTVAGKICAVIVAVSLVGGATVLGISLSKPADENDNPSAIPTQPFHSQPSADHIHHFDKIVFDDEEHCRMCECGAFSEPEAHIFENGTCIVCYFGDEMQEDSTTPTTGTDEPLSFATIAGQWTNTASRYDAVSVPEINISEDGVLLVSGVTYYPVGIEEVMGGSADEVAYIYYQEAPVEPDASMTPEQMHNSPVKIFLRNVQETFYIHLYLSESNDSATISRDPFYRESDFSQSEKLALTVENYLTYYAWDFDQFCFMYTPESHSFLAMQDYAIRWNQTLEPVSWIRCDVTFQVRSYTFAYNVNTDTYEILEKDPELYEETHDIGFYANVFGDAYMNEYRICEPNEDGIIEFTADVIENIIVTHVEGVAYIPARIG